jgi:hypothetical protein
MNEIKKYWPIGLIVLVAVLTTGVAGWQTAVNPYLNTKDTWGFNLWFVPLGYLVITWYFVTTKKLNRPIIALGAILVYGLSVFLLFIPTMPQGLQWHYPIGGACLMLYFLG